MMKWLSNHVRQILIDRLESQIKYEENSVHRDIYFSCWLELVTEEVETTSS